jgi:hypothetical protein
MAMRFSRFQIALFGAALGLAALTLSRGMTGTLRTLKAAVLGEPSNERAP